MLAEEILYAERGHPNIAHKQKLDQVAIDPKPGLLKVHLNPSNIKFALPGSPLHQGQHPINGR